MDVVYEPTIGVLMREYRKRYRLSQDKMADRLNTTQATVSRIERGTNGAGPELMERIRILFGSTFQKGV